MEPLSDEEIIKRILKGEKSLFELILRKYNARLYKVGMSILNNDADVEDLMQAAYIKSYENLEKFQFRSAFATWLTRIMINECLLFSKKAKQTTMQEYNSTGTTDNADREHNPAQKLINKELGHILQNALMQLPDKYRLVFVLREMENMSIAETVDTLGIKEANVKVRLNRAKTMLRDSLSSYYKNDSVYHFHLSRCDRIVSNVFKQLGIAQLANHS